MEQFEKVEKGLQTAVDSDWMWRKADYIAMCCKDAISLIRQQRAQITELEEAQRMMVYQDCLRPDWISVKDILPAGRTNPITLDFEEVLCATTFGDVRAYKYGKRLGDTDAHFWHGAGIMDRYVTHWQYMPKHPKEVQRDT